VSRPAVVDVAVHPYFARPADIKKFIPAAYRSRAIPGIEKEWYWAPGGEFAPGLQEGDTHPGSDPAVVAEHVFGELGAQWAILNPLTRGRIADRHVGSAVCTAYNQWLAEVWLDHPDARGRWFGSIHVEPADPKEAIREIERWAPDRRFRQVSVPMQVNDPFGKPQYHEIWAAAAEHRLPVAAYIDTGAASTELPPTGTGYPLTYVQYASLVPLTYFFHLASLITEGVFEEFPNLVFVFSDGGADMLTPLMWRLDTFYRALREHTPWAPEPPSTYLRDHVRIVPSRLEAPERPEMAPEWFEMTGKSDLLMFGSHYPRWMVATPEEIAEGMTEEQARKVLGGNAAALYGLEPAAATGSGGRTTRSAR
jgi:predicted TIM-barrel fold metal-dependent hydrolase